jgi:chaperonin GroES
VKGAKKPGKAPASAGKKAAPPKPAGRAAQTSTAPSSPGRGAVSPVSAATSGGKQGMAKVRPLRDRVLVKRIEEQEQKVGGIIVPDTAKEKPQQAEVVAVGSGRVLENGQREPLAVKAGDKVLVGKWSGTEVKLDGTEYLIVKEDEILGILG